MPENPSASPHLDPSDRDQGDVSRSPVPFLVGSGRTGLTLLRVIFDSHPDLAMAHEARFVAHMARKSGSYESEDGVDIDRFVHDLYDISHFRRLGLPEAETRAALLAARPRSFPDAVRVVWELYARSQGKTRFGEKAPLNVSHIELLSELFPEARFVHVIRDGRDVSLAYIDAEQAAPRDVAWGAFHWRLRVSRGRRGGARVGPTRYREFRYEELVEDPEKTVREMCEFVGLEYDERMLDYRSRAEEFLVTASHPGDHQHLKLPPTKGLVDWRTRMSPVEVELFESIAGGLLDELGYELVSGGRASSLVVGYQWVRWQVRRLAWRIRWRLGYRPPSHGAGTGEIGHRE